MSSLKIAIVQTELQWENITANLHHFSQLLEAIAVDTDLVVLPEMFLSGFSMNTENIAIEENHATIQSLIAIAKNKKLHIIGSIAIKEDQKYYNRLLHFSPDGKIAHRYDKRHLFCLADEQNYYTSGKERITITINGITICPLICYDLRFPVFSRNDQLQPYDILLYVANWPAKRSYAWKQLLIARAIENVCYTVGVNRIGADGTGHLYNGDSSIINPAGEILADAKSAATVLYCTIDKNEIISYRKNFPFLLDGDTFQLL